MKKTLVIVICVAFFSLSLIAALSGIPHTHHGSPASECPVCKFHLNDPVGLGIIFEAAIFSIFIICLMIYRFSQSVLSDKFCIRSFSPRAPPAF